MWIRGGGESAYPQNVDKKACFFYTSLSLINQWIKKKKMKLNMKKTKNIILSFIKNYKFKIRLIEEQLNIEVVYKVKLLGTIITNDLSWKENTCYLLKKGISNNAIAL